MADYGLKLWDADGNVTLDPANKICRLRYSVVATAGNDGNSGTLSDINGLSTIEFGVPLDQAGAGVLHYVYRSGNVIYWEAENIDPPPPPPTWPTWPSVDTLVVVFLYT